MVLLRTKKRKQQLVLIKLKSVTAENEDIEMILKQEGSTKKGPNSSADQPPYAEIQTVVPPTKSEELIEYLNQNSTVTGEHSEIELEPDGNKIVLDTDQHPSITSVQEAEIYTVPETTNSHTNETPSGNYETVYSEPIQPLLFTDAVGSPSDSEDLQPYAPIYGNTKLSGGPKLPGEDIRFWHE